MDRTLNPILKSYIPIVEGLSKTFGKNCEVILHDFSRMESSIVAIKNGHVTGRSVGSPMTEVGLKAVRKGSIKDNIINYTGKSLEGRALKSSTMFIKDENDVVLGCLCINFDLSELVVAKKVIDELTKTEVSETEKSSQDSGNRVNDVLIDIVKNTLDEVGKPVAYMGKEEKVNIVKKLDNQGAFLIKGAIDYVAKVLCVSRYTIYNYLDEIRVDTK
ncbi:MAG: PAS domain-containing protein [Maledivibacter sp.]|jgi:predicted transcriptional regulator YheO|nr:PAS domain-containing protein [Maledivibacter sp.]